MLQAIQCTITRTKSVGAALHSTLCRGVFVVAAATTWCMWGGADSLSDIICVCAFLMCTQYTNKDVQGQGLSLVKLGFSQT